MSSRRIPERILGEIRYFFLLKTLKRFPERTPGKFRKGTSEGFS